MNVLIVFFFGRAAAQHHFSVFTEISKQPTKDIKVTNAMVGMQYVYDFSPKYQLVADAAFNAENISYHDRNYSDSFLSGFQKLKSALTLRYSGSPKYKYHFKIEPFIADENRLKLSSLYVFSEFKADVNFKGNHTATIGLAHKAVFGKPAIIPIFSYYYKHSDRLNFLAGFPESAVRYSNNIRNTFVLKNEFNGHFYALDRASESVLGTNAKASFSQITASLGYERTIDTHWFLHFKAGYDYNKKYLLLDGNDNTYSDFKIGDGVNLGLTIKYKH